MNTPKSFLVIGILALLWNLMGIAAFIMQYTADLDALAKTDPYQAKIFAEMPGWAWVAYVVAVFSALAATICLLMKRKLAVPLYSISLLAIILQFGHSFLGTDMIAVRGPMVAIFPAVIFILGLAQLLYARAMRAKGVLV